MIESPLMQDVDKQTVEQLKLVIIALERDKSILAHDLQVLRESIYSSGYSYCAACGKVYDKLAKCDCIGGVDYD